MEISWFSIFKSLVVGALVLLTFHLLSKVKRLSLSKETIDFKPTEELKQKYTYLMTAWAFLFVIGAGITFCALYFGFVGLSEIYYSWMQPYDAIERMRNSAIALPTIFAALVIQDYPYNYFGSKYYGKETFDNLNKIASQYYRINTVELNKLIRTIGIVVCLIFYMNVLKTASYIRKETITVSTFLMFFPKQYQLKDVKELVVSRKRKAPNGKIVNRLVFHVHFNDGYVWETDPWEDSRKFIEMLQSKTGLSLREVEMI